MTWAAAWQNQQNDLCAQRRLRSAWASAQLMWVFAGHPGNFVGFVMQQLISYYRCYSAVKWWFLYEEYWLQYKVDWCSYAVKSDEHQYTSYCRETVTKW